MSACLAFTRRVFSAHLAQKGHDFNTLSALKITAAQPGKVIATYRVDPLSLNRANTLHGGLISTLVDTMGSLALSSHGMHSSGVSTSITTTFCRGAPAGSELTIISTVPTVGQTLGFTQVEIYDTRSSHAPPGSSSSTTSPLSTGKQSSASLEAAAASAEAGWKMVAYGSHTKFVGRSKNPEKDVTFSTDGEDQLSGPTPTESTAA